MADTTGSIRDKPGYASTLAPLRQRLRCAGVRSHARVASWAISGK